MFEFEGISLDLASQASGINFTQIAVVLLGISGLASMMYRQWSKARYHNSPHLIARDQLFNFVTGALANHRAWHTSEPGKIAFYIDTAQSAKDNSTTGSNGVGFIGQVGPPPAPKQQFQTIKVGYNPSYTVTMPGGQDVASVFTKRQIASIVKTAKRIGQELDNIAKGQAILSYLPAHK